MGCALCGVAARQRSVTRGRAATRPRAHIVLTAIRLARAAADPAAPEAAQPAPARPRPRAPARPRRRPAARATLAGRDPAGEPPPGPPGRADAPGGGAPPSSPAADRRGLLARRPARAVAFESEVLDLSSGARAPLRPDPSSAHARAAAAFPPADSAAMPPSPLGGAPGGASPGGPGSAGGVPWEYRAPWLYRHLDRRANRGRGLSLRASRSLVLALTFACYAAYHASRKPPSIVKSVLHGGAGSGLATGSLGADVLAGEELPGSPESFANAVGRGLLERGGGRYAAAVEAAAGGPAPPSTSSGWAPFDSLARGKALLGDLDLAFLGSYAAGMFVAGHLGDRVDLRRLLTWGMVGSGLAACAFGAAFFLDIHNMGYFLFVSVSVAAAQTVHCFLFYY
jgi:hypothetical protein